MTPNPKGRREDSRKHERLPCHLKIEVETGRAVLHAPVYEIAMEGILISGPDAKTLRRNETLAATLEGIGACKIRVTDQTPAGAHARFEMPDAAFRERIEDRLWAIRDENTEFVTRAMDAASGYGRFSTSGQPARFYETFRHRLYRVPLQSLQHRGDPELVDRALPDFRPSGQGPAHGVLRGDDRGSIFQCTAGSVRSLSRRCRPEYRQPQPPHLQRPAGLAAGGNAHSYLIQSYARDMGNGRR